MKKLLSSVGYGILLTTVFLAGCSGNPVAPGNESTDELSVSTGQIDSGFHHCLGYYSVIYNADSRNVDIVPIRSGSLHLNITGVLNTTMGVSAVGVPAEHDPLNGIFVFDVTLTHPFGTKPQLAGFDVKGILMTPGTLEIGSLVFADSDETRLLNADSYTRWWNPTEFTNPGMFGYTQGTLANASSPALTATVNPYRYFADVLGAVSDMTPVYVEPMDADGGRGVFTAGCSNTRRYRIKFPLDPGPQVVFGYAVDASWVAPSPNPPTQVPDDFPITANQPEAFYINPVAKINTLYHDSESGQGGGVLRLLVNVHDWQGQDAGNIADEVEVLSAFSPALFTGEVDGIFENENYYRAQYSVDLTDVVIPSQSGQEVVAVQAGSEGGPSYDQGLGPAPSDNVSGWDVLLVDIPDPECTADANNDWIDAVEIEFGGYVIDQLCSPTDYRDFFTFEIPDGHSPEGELMLWCDADPCELELYDSTHALITEAAASSGIASIDFAGLEFMPGEYFIRVFTSDDSFPAPYLLEFTGDLVNVTPSNITDITPDGLYCDPDVLLWDGDYLYMAGFGGFWSWDASDPANPQLIAYERLIIDSELVKSGDYIYFIEVDETNPGYLSVIDVTDQNSPVLHSGIIDYGYEVPGIAIDPQHLFIVSDEGGTESYVTTYDWTVDPLNPEYRSKFTIPVANPRAVEVYDPEGPDTTLIISFFSSVYALNVEDPLLPVIKGNYSCTALYDLAIHENYLCCAGTDQGVTLSLFILRYIPEFGFLPVGSVSTPGNSYEIDVKWPYAYIGEAAGGMSVCDMTTPATPSYILSCSLVSDGEDVKVNGDYLCIIPEGAGFQIFDITTPTDPQSVFLTRVVNYPLFGYFVDDYLVCNDAGDSYWYIKTVNIDDVENPYVTSELPIPGMKPVLLRIYPEIDLGVVARDLTWLLLDVSDPVNIAIPFSKTEAIAVDCMEIWNDVLYVATGNKLKIYDVSSLPPTLQNTIDIPSDPFWMSFKDDFMYLSVSGIAVYSILIPFNPSPLGIFMTPSICIQTEVVGDTLYIALEDRLEIADASDPSSLSYLGSVPVASLPQFARFVGVYGQFAYVSGNMPTVACNVWPPNDPTLLGPIDPDHFRVSAGRLFRDNLMFDFGYPGGIRFYELY